MNWWRHVVSAELRKILAFRTDFWVTFLGQVLVQVLIARALWANIFESSGNEIMEGFTLEMMTLYYLIVPIGSRMLTGENIGFLSREIYDGTFNRYLIYPISFFQYKTLTYLTYSAFYGLQLILVYVLFHFLQLKIPTISNIANLVLGIAFFMLASFAYAMLAMLVELISLWADNIWSLMVTTRFFCFFLGGAFVPLSFFPEWLKGLLDFTPFPYLVSLPVRTTMGIATTSEILRGFPILFLWGLAFLFGARLLWKKGSKSYSGVGI